VSRRRGYRSVAEINITSLVDVMMCLLIIFMLTAPFIQGGVEVSLPEAATREVVVEEGPVIALTANRQIFIDDRVVTLPELGKRLAPLLPRKDKVPIYLRADEQLPYGFVLKVMAAIEKQGFTNLSLMSRQEG
jgi:biopolymer transport protein TolR